jgi:hypothetical protein
LAAPHLSLGLIAFPLVGLTVKEQQMTQNGITGNANFFAMKIEDNLQSKESIMKTTEEIYAYMQANKIMARDFAWMEKTIQSMKRLRTIGIAENLNWSDVKYLYTGWDCLLCLQAKTAILDKHIDPKIYGYCCVCPWKLLEGRACFVYDEHKAAIERYDRWLSKLTEMYSYAITKQQEE